MDAPYEENYKGAVDILLYAHYGSIHAKKTFESTTREYVTSTECVICDGCLSEYKKMQ